MNFDALVSVINTGEPDHLNKVAFYAPQGVKDVCSWVGKFYHQHGTMPTLVAIETNFNLTLPREVDSWEFWSSQIDDEHLYKEADKVFDKYNKMQESDRKAAILGLKRDVVGIPEYSQVKAVDIIRDRSRWDYFKNQERRRIKCGLKPLDDLSGGLHMDGDYWVISARSGIGKSWVALFMGSHMAQGYKVGVYSGEMDEHQVGARVDAMTANIKNSAITAGRQVEGLDELAAKYDQYAGNLFILTPAMIGGNATPKKLREFVRSYDLDVLIIDQLSLVSPDPSTGGKSEWEQRGAVSFGIASLINELKKPVIAVSQQNREAAKQEADLANLAGSDRFGQDATLVLDLSRSGEDKNVLKVRVLKARKFRQPTEAWEFDWQIDEGIFTHRTNAMDGVRARHASATATDTQARVDAENATDEDEELI